MKPLFLKKRIAGAIVALITWCIATAVFSFISLRLEDPKRLLGGFAAVALILGAFLGGRIAGKSAESKVLSSLIASFSVLLPYVVMALVIKKADGFSIAKALLVFISAFVGAFLTKTERRAASSRRIRKNIASKYASYTKG